MAIKVTVLFNSVYGESVRLSGNATVTIRLEFPYLHRNSYRVCLRHGLKNAKLTLKYIGVNMKFPSTRSIAFKAQCVFWATPDVASVVLMIPVECIFSHLHGAVLAVIYSRLISTSFIVTIKNMLFV